MSRLKSKGNGLFIESFRTPSERTRAEKDKRVKEVLDENAELKARIDELEQLIIQKLGVKEEEINGQ